MSPAATLFYTCTIPTAICVACIHRSSYVGYNFSLMQIPLHPCRRSLILILAMAAVLLAQGVYAQRRGFRLPISLPPVTGIPPTLISCGSVLVKANPDNYPHCHCQFGSWSPYQFSSYGSSSTCPSGKKYVLDSTRRRLSTKCTKQPTTERRTKDVCKWCLHT